jgi:hypothetical protein
MLPDRLIDGRRHDRNPSCTTKLAVVIDHMPNLAASKSPIAAMARRVYGSITQKSWRVGMSSALHEATELDERYARYVNDNLADYLVPVNANASNVDVILVAEQNDHIIQPASKALANSAMSEPTRPSAMRFPTLPANAFESCP